MDDLPGFEETGIADQLHNPEQVLFVLGNHDYAHLGGPRTRKFHDDEAAFLTAIRPCGHCWDYRCEAVAR